VSERLFWRLIPVFGLSALLIHWTSAPEHSRLALGWLPWLLWACLHRSAQPQALRTIALALPLLAAAASLDFASGGQGPEFWLFVPVLLGAFVMWLLTPLSAWRWCLLLPVLVAWILPVLGAEQLPQAPAWLDWIARLSPLDLALRAPVAPGELIWPAVGTALALAAERWQQSAGSRALAAERAGGSSRE
jgi:hypothetical protein